MDVCMNKLDELTNPFGTGLTRPCTITPLDGSAPHALLYEQSHDNPSYNDKWTAEHTLAIAGIVAFGSCAVGSVKGFDDLYPKYVNVVKETRSYEVTGLSENSGISRAKRVLNGLRREIILRGYTEGSVWHDFDVSGQSNICLDCVLCRHFDYQYISMTRVNPVTGHGYVLVAHTACERRGAGRSLCMCFIDFLMLHLLILSQCSESG